MPNNTITIYDPMKDNEFHRLYGAKDAKAVLEWDEAYLLKEGTSYMIVGYLADIDAFTKKEGKQTDYKYEFKGLFASMQIETEGEKSNPFLKWMCEALEQKVGLGKDNPWVGILSLNSLNPQTFKLVTDPNGDPNVKEGLIINSIPALSKLEKLNKLEGKTPPNFSKGGNNNRYGGGAAKPLTPKEKWDSVKPLLGVEGGDLKAVAKVMSNMDIKERDALLGLVGAICQ